MPKTLLAVRLSDETRRKLDALAQMYGTKTTALEVAIDRLYQDTEQADKKDDK